jgi:hypothetical protein
MTSAEQNRALRALVERVEVRRAESYRQPVAERITVVVRGPRVALRQLR